MIETLLGLDDFPLTSSGLLHPATTLSSGQIALAPDDLKTIYDIHRLHAAGMDGTGQKIAIVGQTSIDLADIQGFRQDVWPEQLRRCR